MTKFRVILEPIFPQVKPDVKQKKLKVRIPYYVDLETAQEMFGVGKTQIYSWIHLKKLDYSVLSTDKRAKKRFRSQDIIKLMDEHMAGAMER